MSTVQNVLYFAVTVPVALFIAAQGADTGYSRYRLTIDWPLFFFLGGWALALVAFVWTLIR